MRRMLCAALFATAITGLAGCDEKLSTIAGPTPNLEPTFTSIQRDIFEAADSSGRRNCTACHSSVGRAPSGGMSLDHNVAYDSIVGVASSRKTGAIRIVPGDPEASYLVQKVEGASGIVGVRMPQGGPYLSDGQILILRRWIQLGAPRN
jgi:hypothetical protein